MAGVRSKSASQKKEVTAGASLATKAKPRGADTQEDLFSEDWAAQLLDSMSKAKEQASEASSQGRSLRETSHEALSSSSLNANATSEKRASSALHIVSEVSVESSASFASSQTSPAEPINMEPPKAKIYSISELSGSLRDTLRESFGEIMVQGEICDFKGVHRNGHLYFGLKDEKSQMRAVMWRPALQKVPFEVKGGLEVIVTGRLDYYGGSGSLQIIVERMEPVGMGALQLKLEQLKEKLRLEGLFDVARKRKVAAVNWRIGVVTGKSTAALQDILKVYRTRFPLAEVFVFHATVQGENAPREICRAIDLANRYSASCERALDVLVVGRGGGSYEDLFCFNDESIVRAIVASTLPVVSAVGHEIDVTLADFAADKRSATPSHAAQETVPEMALWLQRLEDLNLIFERRARMLIQDYQQRIDTLYNRMVAAAPQKKLATQKQFLKDRELLLVTLMQKVLMRYKAQIARGAAVLDALSPLKVLERGYAVATLTETGHALRSVRDAKSGSEVELLLSDGKVGAKIL
jgi:exodeoxyribonuclease VII large subunit